MSSKVHPKFFKDKDYLWVNEDCLEWMRSLEDNSIDLIFTSPPYAQNKSYDKSLEETMELYLSVAQESMRVLRPTGSICWQVGSHVHKGEVTPLFALSYDLFKSIGFKFRGETIWHFEHGLHAKKRLSGRHEYVLWFTKGDDYFFNLDFVRTPQKNIEKKKDGQLTCNPLGKNPGSVWKIPNVNNGHREKIKDGHPCQTPIELIRRFLGMLCPSNGVVYDPFGGVASTVVSALSLGIKVMASENNSRFYDLGLNRIVRFEKSLGSEYQPLRPDLTKENMKRFLSDLRKDARILKRKKDIEENSNKRAYYLGAYQATLEFSEHLKSELERDHLDYILEMKELIR